MQEHGSTYEEVGHPTILCSTPPFGFPDETHTTFAVFTLAVALEPILTVVERTIFLGCLISALSCHITAFAYDQRTVC